MARSTAPVPFLSWPGVQLFLTSAQVLFAELALIRWVPANVTHLGFFSNFLLIGSFLGIGAGILAGRRIPSCTWAFSLLLLGMTALVLRHQLNVAVATDQEIYFSVGETLGRASFFVLPIIVAISALTLAALALPLGGLLTAMPPLRAYAIDIMGSLAGIAGFAALSYASTTPAVWFSVLAGLLGVAGLGRPTRPSAVVTVLAMASVIGLNATSRPAGGQEIWSPYYRIDEIRTEEATILNVNGIPHQGMWRASRLIASSTVEPVYSQIYRWLPGRKFERALIVGAGSGTDVAVALAQGVGRIDAVEIDPVIAALGRADNPDRPYANAERVSLTIDDGRSFVGRSSGPYDLVIFALPDSLTLASTSADIRLESFLFTKEAFLSVKRVLAPGGVFVLYNFYRKPWLLARIDGMLESVFGSPPLVRSGMGGALGIFAVAGPGGNLVGPTLEAAILEEGKGLPEPTDDWPFPYLRQPTIPTHYLVALAMLLVFGGALVGIGARVSGTPVSKFSPHFFVLGSAFMLLETKSLATFSLLFGTTWTVNAMASFAILVSVLASIAINAHVRLARPWPLYAALFLALALAWAIPPESIRFEALWLRYAASGVLAFAPIVFANLVFTRSFRDSRTADMAFASNLLGATIGGALEYLALVTGYRALLIVVLLLYLLAYGFARVFPVLADRELESAASPAPTAA